MRFILVALLAGLCAVSAVSVDTHNYGQRQKSIWRLFKYINQPSYYKDHVEIANNFHFYENKELYSKYEAVEEFYTYYKYGMLQRGEIFSVFYEEHLKQAVALFKLFYYANDFDTFYKTAVWARQNVNEGMFLYSFSVALIHRPDTYYFTLPPIYEIYPYYFYNTEVIQEAQNYKQMYNSQYGAKYNGQTIYANYSGYYLNLHPEQSLSYYTEDVGINSFYYYYNLYYPFWMSGKEFNLKNDNRGEVFFYMYQQILARYYLERLSNGFGQIEGFNWEVPFETGYTPSLCYPNGLEFPTRPNFAHLYQYFYNYGQHSTYGFSYTHVQDYERRIREAIDFGYVFNKNGEKVGLFSQEGINILGNLIEGNPDSPYYHYYGAYQVFARHLLGYSYQPLNYHQVNPSALEHFETSMRDPAFYQLYKKLVTYFYKYKYQHQQHYTQDDLIYKGIFVKNVEFDQLITYFDYFYADLSNAVYVTPEEFVQDSFKVQVAQQRINHKPFTYKIYVDADKHTDAVVKVFLGPKYDEYGRYINLTENYMNFVQFDHFTYKLNAGKNVIVRNSKDIYNYIHDRTSYYQLYQKAFGVYDEKKQNFQFHDNQIWYGYPQRFMLPKGSSAGTTYQFYVLVTKYVPYEKVHDTNVPIVGSGMQYVDGYPMGYPFDRPVYKEHIFYEVPNSYFYEAKIYHVDSEHKNYNTEYQTEEFGYNYQTENQDTQNTYNNQYQGKYHGQYKTQYKGQYNTQYENQRNTQHQDQYNTQQQDQYNTQYQGQYNTQYNDQY